jgi:hypothetical protein
VNGRLRRYPLCSSGNTVKEHGTTTSGPILREAIAVIKGIYKVVVVLAGNPRILFIIRTCAAIHVRKHSDATGGAIIFKVMSHFVGRGVADSLAQSMHDLYKVLWG